MHRVITRLALAIATVAVFGQEMPSYALGENPFQGDYALTIGEPVVLRAEVEGIWIDELTVTSLAAVKPGEKIKCEVSIAGMNKTDKKAHLTSVLLLEDGEGKALERVTLDPFKAKPGKQFREKKKLVIANDTLAFAHRVYVFIQVSF